MPSNNASAILFVFIGIKDGINYMNPALITKKTSAHIQIWVESDNNVFIYVNSWVK